MLDRVGDADAAKPAACACLLAALIESRMVGNIESRIHIAFERAAIVRKGQPGLEWHLLRRDHVAPAELDPVDPHFARCLVDRALDRVGGFRPPRAPIGRYRGCVREQAGDLDAYRWRAVNPCQATDIRNRREGPKKR